VLYRVVLDGPRHRQGDREVCLGLPRGDLQAVLFVTAEPDVEGTLTVEARLVVIRHPVHGVGATAMPGLHGVSTYEGGEAVDRPSSLFPMPVIGAVASGPFRSFGLTNLSFTVLRWHDNPFPAEAPAILLLPNHSPSAVHFQTRGPARPYPAPTRYRARTGG
jgi:hypothetical protein